MRKSTVQYPMLAIAIMAIAVCAAGMLFFVLWRDYLLYAVVASALLSGGAVLPPSKNAYLHGLSLGLCLGAFVGSFFGAVKAFGAEATVTSNQSLQRTYSPPAELIR